ncbi:trypsin-like peptidase domain-containing protein [Streptomyces sp. SBC-4]|nr:trypsin-like peptidase domain-containing protein [Streptomyces sp. SBC-4]MDV5143342.1 trypsin-like peptidase domain-containing protein [Streptomyces sp. SBC-4]
MVGPYAVMTDRHVAAEFSRAEDAGWNFQQGMSARFDPGEELPAHQAPGLVPAPSSLPYELVEVVEVVEVIGIHPEVAMVLLRIAPPNSEEPPTPLAVAADAPASVPAGPCMSSVSPRGTARRNEPESMRRILMDLYNGKRLQPGTTTEFTPGGRVTNHDCSPLGGNSGSPVLDLTDHRILGLHFGGRYRIGNVAVPLWELVDDPLLAQARVRGV